MANVKRKTAAAAEVAVKGKGETVKGADGSPLIELGPIEQVKVGEIKAGINVCRPDGHTAAHLAALALAMPSPAHQRDPVWLGKDGTLVAGFGRFAVATAGKWPTILVRRILNDTPAVRTLANLCENERSDERIGVMGRAAAYAALQRDGMSVRAIAAATGNAKSTDVVVDVCRIGDAAKTHPLVRAALDAYSKGIDGAVKVKWVEAGEKGEKAREGETIGRPFGVVRHVSKADMADQPAILRATGTMSSDEARVYVSAYRDAKKAGKSADEARKDAAAAARPAKGTGTGKADSDGDGEERTTDTGGNGSTDAADKLRAHLASLTVPAIVKAHHDAGSLQAKATKASETSDSGMDADEVVKALQTIIATLSDAMDGLRKACGSAAFDAAKTGEVRREAKAHNAKAATKARR